MRAPSALLFILLLALPPSLLAQGDEAPRGKLVGRVVTTDGAPSPYARLDLYPLDTLEEYGPSQSVSADANGSFSIELSEGLHRANIHPSFDVDARPARPLELSCRLADNSDCVVIRAGVATTRDFVLLPGGALRGVVRDTQGDAVRSANLRLASGAEQLYGYTERGGFYSVTAPPGVFPVRVDTYGSNDPFALPFALRCAALDRSDCARIDDGLVTWLNITLPAGGLLRGALRDDEGAALQDASVTFDDERDSQYLGPDGTFEKVLSEGEHVVLAQRNYGGAVLVEASVTMRARQVTYLNLTAPPSTTLRGLVLGDGGEPVRAMVEAQGATGYYRGATNESGVFSLRVDPGEYSLIVRPQDDRSGYARWTCATDEPCVLVEPDATTWRNVTMERGGTLRGIVKSPEGRAVSSVSVRALRDGASADSTFTGGDGAFLFTLRPGAYGLLAEPRFDGELLESSASCDGVSTGCFVVTGGATTWANLTLTAAAVLEGSVLLPSGEGLRGAHVSITSASETRTATTESGGVFRFAVPGGSYALAVVPTIDRFTVGYDKSCRFDVRLVCEADPSGFGSDVIAGLASHHERCIDEAPCVALVPGIENRRDITLVAGHALRGVVRAPDGAPVRDVEVVAKGASSEGRTSTDAAGAYEIALEPGAYGVSVRGPRYVTDAATGDAAWRCETGSEATCVRVEGATTHDITLPPAARLEGTVRGPDGEALERVFLAFLPAEGPPEYAYVDPAGRYAVALPAGAFGVRGETGDGVLAPFVAPCPGAACIRVEAGERASFDINFSRGMLVRGVVRDTSGAPLPGARVEAAFPASVENVTDAEGRFAMRLPAGEPDIVAARFTGDRPARWTLCAACVRGGEGDELDVDIILARPSSVVDVTLSSADHGGAVLFTSEAAPRRPVLVVVERVGPRPAPHTTLRIDGAPVSIVATGTMLAWQPSTDVAPGLHTGVVERSYGGAPVPFAFTVLPPASGAPPASTMPAQTTPDATVASPPPTSPTPGPGLLPVTAALALAAALLTRGRARRDR